MKLMYEVRMILAVVGWWAGGLTGWWAHCNPQHGHPHPNTGTDPPHPQHGYPPVLGWLVLGWA